MTTSTTSQPYSGVPFDNASVAGRLAELPATADAEALTVSTDQGEFAAFRARPAHPNPDLGDAVLMHGWPEFASCWEKTAALLLEQGMGVFAYDQRGYSPGVRPDSVGGYAIARLVADLDEVSRTAGLERFHLVGHDWGWTRRVALCREPPTASAHLHDRVDAAPQSAGQTAEDGRRSVRTHGLYAVDPRSPGGSGPNIAAR